MVDWNDPVLLRKDYIALVRLYHTIGGIYIWETVLTAGFELDVLRRNRPYMWTVWLYLGTRYTGLLSFIIFFIYANNPGVPCNPLMKTYFALSYVTWAFASFIIVLRVIAIWNRNFIVTLIAVGVWLAGIALKIRRLTIIVGTYSQILDTCITTDTHKGIVNTFGVLVVDIVLLLAMLIGLLRLSHKNPTSVLWKLLYQQCVAWLALAACAEIPLVVLAILNFNNAWNEMLVGPALAILSISAARMYRSLSNSGSFTEYVPSDLPQFSTGAPNQIMNNPTIHFASITHSMGTRAGHEAPGVPANRQNIHIVLPG